MNKTSYKISFAGLFIALGIIIPYATSHVFGIAGTLLLPMHIPILLCGLITGPVTGAICGLLVPLASSLITGMPVMYPMLPIMAAQLTVMGFVSGMMRGVFKKSILISLIVSIVSGWAAYGIVFSLLGFVSRESIRALSMFSAISQGALGIGLQVVLIPPIVSLVSRSVVKDSR